MEVDDDQEVTFQVSELPSTQPGPVLGLCPRLAVQYHNLTVEEGTAVFYVLCLRNGRE